MTTLSVLCGAMAPTISAAFGLQGGLGLGEICTVRSDSALTQGSSSDHRDPTPGIDHVLEHCPYCSSHVAHLGMPPAVLTDPVLALAYATHSYYLAAAPTLRLWSDARSRAPPQAV